MAIEERTYTLEEIEKRSGFDRRTITYYVQEDILPRVGRRGPKTRYPQQFLDRLLFIKKLRDLQDTGKIGPVTLDAFRLLFAKLPAELVADVASGREPLDVADLRLAEPPYARIMGDAKDEEWETQASMSIPESELRSLRAARRAEQSPSEGELKKLLTRLQDQASLASGMDPEGEGAWTTEEIADGILIAARGRRPSSVKLVQRLAKLLRGLMRGR
jgi:DNA-binding transcriptional MerR regulator